MFTENRSGREIWSAPSLYRYCVTRLVRLGRTGVSREDQRASVCRSFSKALCRVTSARSSYQPTRFSFTRWLRREVRSPRPVASLGVAPRNPSLAICAAYSAMQGGVTKVRLRLLARRLSLYGEFVATFVMTTTLTGSRRRLRREIYRADTFTLLLNTIRSVTGHRVCCAVSSASEGGDGVHSC